jgi:hypothetical protein
MRLIAAEQTTRYTGSFDLSVFWDGGWGIIKLTELFIFLYPCYNLK